MTDLGELVTECRNLLALRGRVSELAERLEARTQTAIPQARADAFAQCLSELRYILNEDAP